MASKPVAKTMMSKLNSVVLVLMPSGVMHSMGVSRRLTKSTWSELNVSKYPLSMGGRLAANGWSISLSCSALTGSVTVWRILFRMKSAAVLFESGFCSKSLNVARNCRPPLIQASSYIWLRSSSLTSWTKRSEIRNGCALVLLVITSRK